MIKKFLRGVNVSLLLLIIISTFSSCANEMNVFEENNNKQINFLVSVPEWKNIDSLATTKTSRATPITDNSFGADKSFNLIADQNDGAGNYTALIDNESVSFTNNLWQTNPSHYYWSGIANKTINFYAYYPTSISTSITHTAGSSPTLSYTVPDNVSNQIDIITATGTNISGNTNSSTPLTFNHIFAAVKFAVGTNGLPSGTIKSISISGINNSGTYTFGSGWSNVTGSNTFVISPSTVITGTSGANITSDTYTLMMIPQIFTSATITLTYNTGTSYKQTISGTWNANNIYTYNLSKPVNVGDYYYSDGTWGTIAEHANSTAQPIAVIFSNSTTTTDNGHGWTHGYGMALTNAATSVTWGPLGVTALQDISTWSEIVNERDGYSNTQLISARGLSSYPAFYNACNYMVTAPSNSSNWFLPSVGQWYNIAVNLGKIPATYTHWSTAEPGWDGYANYCASNINSYLSVINVSTDKFSNNAEYYWCSSEYTSNFAYRSFFSPDGVFWLDGNDNDDFKNLNYRVRPVIAF